MARFIRYSLFLAGLAVMAPAFAGLAAAQEPPPSPGTAKALTEYLMTHRQPAEDYIVSQFKTHDAIFLGEDHYTRQRLLFLQRLIPALYKAGVYNLGYEMCTSDDQSGIDKLLNAPAYDEAAVFTILQHWDFTWVAQEYADVFRAAWELNRRLPKGAPRFRIVGIDVKPDYRLLKPGVDPASAEARNIIVGGDRDANRNMRMAEVLRKEVLSKGLKALLWNGGGHSTTRYRRPSASGRSSAVSEAGKVPGTRRSPFGFLIHSEIGDRAMCVWVDGPCPRSVPPVLLDGGKPLAEAVLASLRPGEDSIGFSTKGSPIGSLVVNPYKTEPVKLEDYWDGYLFIAMHDAWEAATPNLRYITEERVKKAKQEGSLPNIPSVTVDSIKKQVYGLVSTTNEGLKK
jgi:hypothetical protein